MRKTGFRGEVPLSCSFCARIRSLAKSADELLMRASWIAKKFDGKACVLRLSAARAVCGKAGAR